MARFQISVSERHSISVAVAEPRERASPSEVAHAGAGRSAGIGAPTIVLAHGAGAGMDSSFMRAFRDGLAERGLRAVTFNFPYMEGRRHMPDPQPVLRGAYRAVLAFLRESMPPHTRSGSGPRRPAQSPHGESSADALAAAHAAHGLVIGGKSLGGRVASYLAAEGEGVDGLVFLGYPLHPPGQSQRLRDEHLYAIRQPMLFVQGTRDPFARRDLLERVIDKLGPAATLRWIEGGDHSLAVRGKGRRDDGILDAIAAWVGRISVANPRDG